MNEIKAAIISQLKQLQMFMHRASYHGHMGHGKRHDPYRGQGRILTLLKMKPEINQRELTYLLDMSKQSLAELLVKLEKNGYITREHSEEDKRALTIKLTAEGETASENIDSSATEAFYIFDCLNEDELVLFSDFLGRITKRYEEQFPDEDYEERRKMRSEFMSSHHHDSHYGEKHKHKRHGRCSCRHDGHEGKHNRHNQKTKDDNVNGEGNNVES